MELDISAHAIVRMYDRHISRNDIEEVLMNPLRVYEDDDAVVYDGVGGWANRPGRCERWLRSATSRDRLPKEALMEVRYDLDADALYVRLRPTEHARTEEVDSRRLVDYDDKGEVIGVEFLFVSKGISLKDVPEAARVAQALRAVPHPSAA